MMGCHGQETSLMASGRWLPYVDKIPCDGPIGVCARRLTAERSPRTKMLRALKTLQPENDTRRLRLVSASSFLVVPTRKELAVSVSTSVGRIGFHVTFGQFLLFDLKALLAERFETVKGDL